MTEPKQFCVVVARFAISGVPLAQIRLAKALASRGHKVDLIVGYLPPEYTMPEIDGINLMVWDKPKVRGMIAAIIGYLRRARPDAVFTAGGPSERDRADQRHPRALKNEDQRIVTGDAL